MNQNDVITSKEWKSLLCMAILPKLFFSFLPDSVGAAGTAVWYTNLCSALICIVFFLLMRSFMKQYPGKTLPEIFQLVLGTFLGKGAGTLFYLYFVAYTADLLGEGIQLIKIYNFPNTPFWIFTTGFLLINLFLFPHGTKGIIKGTSFLFYPVLFAVLLALAVGSKQYRMEYLFPLGGYGINRSLLCVGGGLSVYTDLILLLSTVIPKSKKETRSLFHGLLICVGVIGLSSLCYLLTFGYRSSQGKTVGLVEIVQNVYFNSLFQRMEALFFLFMVIGMTVSVCIWCFLSLKLYSTVYGISEKKELLFPHLLMIFALANVSQVQTKEFSVTAGLLFRYGGGVLFAFCIFVWGIAQVRRRKIHD